MPSKKTLGIGAGVIALAAAGVAFAAIENHEANENRIIGPHSEKHVALNQVPQPVMAAANARLGSVREAELATRKADGSTVYEIEGKSKAGKKMQIFVSPDGKVLGSSNGDDDDDDDRGK